MQDEGKHAGVAIRLTPCAAYSTCAMNVPDFEHFLPEIIQIVVVLDASAVQAELRWRLRSRTKPTARTGLHEAIESGAVSAVAPLFLKEEVQKYIPRIATEFGVAVELVETEWLLIQPLIVFYQPIGDPSRFALVDPKDADYALTARELYVDFVRTNDAHFARMGLAVLGPELDAVLRDYARSTSVLVAFKVGSAFVVTIGVDVLSRLCEPSPPAFAVCPRPSRLSWSLRPGLPFSIQSHVRYFPNTSREFGNVCEGCTPRLFPLPVRHLSIWPKPASTSHTTRKAIESRLTVRAKQTALSHARVICIRAAEPLSTAEIARRILANGYASRSKSFPSYVRRLLRSDRRFVVGSDGLWSLRAAAQFPVGIVYTLTREPNCAHSKSGHTHCTAKHRVLGANAVVETSSQVACSVNTLPPSTFGLARLSVRTEQIRQNSRGARHPAHLASPRVSDRSRGFQLRCSAVEQSRPCPLNLS